MPHIQGQETFHGLGCQQCAQDTNVPCGTKNSKCLHLGISPIKVSILCKYLEDYVNKEDAKILGRGFQYGFKIEYAGPRTAFECRNLKSAFDHEAQLMEKINKEIELGRIAGPFAKPPYPNLHVSPVGLIPKTDGGWRLITHLSYP